MDIVIQSVNLVIGVALFCGSFFGFGVLWCRWIDERPTRKRFARRGTFKYGGLVEKGGNNPWPPQVTVRPPAPAPLAPAAPPDTGGMVKKGI